MSIVVIPDRTAPVPFSLPSRGRAGVGAGGVSIARRPHPHLPPAGEGAKP